MVGEGKQRANRAAVEAVHGFLGGPSPDGDEFTFTFGEHLESNWGAVYGGALAAGAVSVARCAAPDRSPRSLHLQIVRSVPRGAAFATVDLRHAGRTVATVEVQLFDERRKLAAIALLTMVNPDALATECHDTTAMPFRERMFPVAHLIRAPIQGALRMLPEKDGVVYGTLVESARPSVDGSVATGCHITVPWAELDTTGPEAACLVADAATGGPIVESSLPPEVFGPNADLTLRFTTAPATREIASAATLLSVQHGTATVALEVHAGDNQLAHGLATSLLLPRT